MIAIFLSPTSANAASLLGWQSTCRWNFRGLNVDVEYNRDGATPKRLDLPEACANFRNDDGEALVVPDVIVHQRGHNRQNVLVLELKKRLTESRATATEHECAPYVHSCVIALVR